MGFSVPVMKSYSASGSLRHWLEGQLFETGEKLRVTQFDEMQRFIAEQLAPIKQMEEVNFNA